MDTLLPRLHAPEGSLALVVTSEAGDEDALDDRGLAALAARHLERLEARGLVPGDTIAVLAEPRLETLVALVAQLVGGYLSLPLDPKLGDAELAHVLADATPRLVVRSAQAPVHPRLEALEAMDVERRAGARAAPRERPILPTPALLLYTSGTTGLPKGAPLSLANVTACLDGLAEAWAWEARDTIVHALPLFHVHGLVLGLLGALRRGGALSWVPRFSPEAIARALGRVTAPRRAVLFAVPTMHHRLIDAAEKDPAVREALSSAHRLVSGSAGLPLREHERIREVTGQRVVERYGMTETLITVAVPADAPRPGSVGFPLRGVEVRFFDEGGARIEAPGEDAVVELAVRGPSVFAGYLNRPDATREVLDEEGFFHTGDLVTRAADGAIRIVGRRSTDLIKCGGFKIGAGEVEAALLEHPSVREAAVVGRPDPDLGERVVAFVVLADPSQDVRGLEDHVAKLLSPHKRPREVHVVAALPRNAMGKVQKKRLP